MNNKYGGLIWTDHVLSRMQERDIKQSDVLAALRNPDSSRYNRSKRNWTYIRDFGKQKIGIIAKKNENNEWIMLSVWLKE